MLPYALFCLIHSFIVNAIDDNNITLGFISTKDTCPLDPFHDLRIHATPKLSDPICCLVPPASEDLTQADEFLSFEEWKSKQLSLEARSSNTQPPNQTSHVDLNNSDTTSNSSSIIPSTSSLGDTETVLDLTPTQLPHFRVPLTDRFNYASLDCSARIRSSHSSATSPSSLLSSKKDRYMLSPCSALPNYVVVELCDDIRIDTVQLANFEYFSGVFRDFKVSVAQTYTKDEQAWVEAGTYRAKNIRGVQSFHPLIELKPFFRYIRIDILSHYGNEYYCPISLLRVYGLTQLEEWKWELWQSASEPTSSSLPNSIAIQTTELDNIITTNELSSLVEEEPSARVRETLIPVASSQLATDPNLSIHNQPIPTSLSSPPASSSGSVVQPTESLTNPTNSPDPAISHSSTATILTSSNASYPSGDSIFRTIMNRLNMLEANTTLYHKYVEEQTLRLRDALRKLEEDVGRLEGLNKNQQQIFFKTIQELNRHHRQMETERSVLRDRVDRLADEVILEKRLGIAQLCLLLTLLIFMTLTRGSRTNVSALFSGPTDKTGSYARSRWSSSLDLSDNPARPRSKTPAPGVSRKKVNRVRSHSITIASTSTTVPRSPRGESRPTIARSPTSVGNDLPTYRLHRSDSNTTPIYPFTSAKRLAQTAHLHEIPTLKRHKTHANHDQIPLGPSNNMTPRRRKVFDAIDGNYIPDNKTDKTSDSWIDTEPGSGPSDNERGYFS